MKYFGRVLPPKCSLRGCWLTDDGEHYYCTDFTCNRHLYRRTKHNRYSRFSHLDPEKAAKAGGQQGEKLGTWPLIYFKCPKCFSPDIQMRIMKNLYECSKCQYSWR